MRGIATAAEGLDILPVISVPARPLEQKSALYAKGEYARSQFKVKWHVILSARAYHRRQRVGLVGFEISNKGNSRAGRTKVGEEGDSHLPHSRHLIFTVSPDSRRVIRRRRRLTLAQTGGWHAASPGGESRFPRLRDKWEASSLLMARPACGGSTGQAKDWRSRRPYRGCDRVRGSERDKGGSRTIHVGGPRTTPWS